IVFSCWTKTLYLASGLFQNHGIRYNMIDGSLPLAERIKVLKDFRSLDGANILLMTLGTGAVGLNLAIASRIYLLEPQWNPSIESQAIGRALRLGQTAQVVIIRYVMKDTIEENDVLFRQQRKLELAGGGFNKGKDMPPERFQALLVR
ncbi:P-loop containing nucleoside triphosphate hydrolase protein, partial [Xylaria flabelliformis]